MCLNEISGNCGVKKILTGTSCDHESSVSCGHSPHTMSKFAGERSRCVSSDGPEATYATVKRTVRPPRERDNHVYQYPLTLVRQNGNELFLDSDSTMTQFSNDPFTCINEANDKNCES